ncbi:MAG: ABC transporter transmembrane domain-containing protein [Gammaproteobacteria bacterium]|nr:ABC transporter transmembrane domain-containing protein [Gammaproteobacteria bacterium]
MEYNIFRYILRHSKREQLVIVVLTSLSLPFYYVSLEIPKLIINKALGADVEHFPHALNLFGHEIVRLGQIPWLLLLCLIFLFAVLVTGGLKYQLNVYKGLLGERLLRQLRLQLCSRILRFPLAHFRKVSPGELNAMITAEVEPLGGFIGDAFAVPLLQGGLLLTAMLFIFVQDPVLGVAAIALFPVQGYVIPKLRREVLELSRERVKEVRKLSTRIDDTVAMTREIRTNAVAAHELSALDKHLARLLDIRFRIFRRKFFVKFLNNFLFQLTPFLFLLVGGYLVIQGELTIGALVAVLAAYKDLPPPAKELLDYYQEQQDAYIKYEQVIAQFTPPGMYAPEFVAISEISSELVESDIVVSDLTVIEDDVNVIEGISFTAQSNEHVAILGASDRPGQTLAQALVRLVVPTHGTISVGDQKLDRLSPAQVGRTFGYLDSEPGFLTGTIAENLFYGRDTSVSQASREEAMRMLKLVELENDMYQFGLQAVINSEQYSELTQRLVEARRLLHTKLGHAAAGALFEPFDRRKYCAHASIAENLLFGEPINDTFAASRLVESRYVMRSLKRAKVMPDLIRLGCEAATISQHAHVSDGKIPRDAEGQSLVHADDLPLLRGIPERVASDGIKTLSKSERQLVLSISFKLIASRHQFCVIDKAIQSRVLNARAALAEELPSSLRGHIAFFDPESFNTALTIQDNLLFGRLMEEQPHTVKAVSTVIHEVVDELSLRAPITDAGLAFHVGVGGRRLQDSQRQRIAIARVLLKRPQVLIACRATNEVDSVMEERIVGNVAQELRERCMIWVLDRDVLARYFDKVLVLQHGRLVAGDASSELRGQQIHPPQTSTCKRVIDHE